MKACSNSIEGIHVTSRTGVFTSDVALVYGAGPAGLNILQVLTGVHGIRTLITDTLDERLAFASTCGAAQGDAINTAREPLPEALARRGLEGAVTLIYDAVGHPSILDEAIRLAAPAARIGMLGFSSQPSSIVQQEMTRKELTLCASRLNCGMFPTVIDWICRGLVDPARIITHTIDFRDVLGAFEVAERNPHDSCKVLLDFGADA